MGLTTGAPASAYSSPVNFRIPQTPDSKLPQEVQNALAEIYMGFQQVIFAFTDNCGIGPRAPGDWDKFNGFANSILQQNMGRFYATAAENIPFGAMINLVNVASTTQIQNANATNLLKPAVGYCSTPGGILAGAVGEVILGGGICPIGGIIPGTIYYLSTTNGVITNIPPTAAGNIEQFVGVGLENNFMYANIGGFVRH